MNTFTRDSPIAASDLSTITAEQMKDHAEANAHRNTIFGLIYRAASDGRTSMLIVGPIDDIEQKLTNNGFRLQPTMSGHIVSWN